MGCYGIIVRRGGGEGLLVNAADGTPLGMRLRVVAGWLQADAEETANSQGRNGHAQATQRTDRKSLLHALATTCCCGVDGRARVGDIGDGW